ncbi:MAG: type II secretion system major pseudopilin GspG [Alphaproteobacteria bacterium]|nr:type II secretion system major pseudopilin GspG [Alphaproteobacteria bacterium]MCB9793440.1 type II secretion system major pseudopilin GspG [Alphaproteobacteria bacterium]
MTRKSLFRRGLASQRGMTLVEIMVVIAILGTLMSVIAFGAIGALDDGNIETTKIQMKQIESALQLYAAKNKGKFPTTSEGLEAAKKHFPDGSVPKDSWGNSFLYFSPGSNSSAPYEIISLGKDGVEGGEDANADIQSWTLKEDG